MKQKEKSLKLTGKYATSEIIKSAIAGIISNGLDFFISGVIIYIEGYTHYNGFIGMIMGTTRDGLQYSPPISVYLFATFLAFVVAFVTNYLLSIFYVFKHGHIGKRRNGLLLFGVFAILSMIITILGSFIFHSLLDINLWIVKISIMIFVFILNIFFKRKYIFNINSIIDENTIHLPQSITNDDDLR